VTSLEAILADEQGDELRSAIVLAGDLCLGKLLLEVELSERFRIKALLHSLAGAHVSEARLARHGGLYTGVRKT
jgi:hypothetical protein